LVGRRESVLCTLYRHASLVQTRRQGLGIFNHACGIFSTVSTRLIQRIGQCSNSIPVSIVYQTRELSAFHFRFNLLLSNNYSSVPNRKENTDSEHSRMLDIQLDRLDPDSLHPRD